jgi:hypothetical protein
VDSLLALAGFGLIGTIVWEVFKDLFHPGNSGALTEWLGRHLFMVCRRKRALLSLAGPLTVVLVIVIWVLALVVGFAFTYYGSFPDGFRTSTGSIPAPDARMPQALYFSFETLITLGYGDLVPQNMWLRFLSATEALIGFGLLTASVSSIVLLYPAVSRMRLLAGEVSNMVSAERRTGLSLGESLSESALMQLARQVTNVQVDLVHFPVIYFFAANDQRVAVSHWTAHLARFAREGLARQEAPIRLAAGALDSALDHLSALIAERFIHMNADDREAVFRALAGDHATEVA